MNSAQKLFVKYLRTKMLFSLRFRSVEDEMRPVHISANEISERFFPYPKYNPRKEVRALHEAGEIRITKQGKANFYEALKPGGYDLNLLQLKAIPQDATTQTMLTNIQKVSLPDKAPSTPYFNLFLKYRNIKPELFFTIDDFCGRVHTPISNFHRTHRPNLLIDNDKTTSLDVATMQPLLLGKLLNNVIGNNEYSTWINEGRDIYIELQNKARLNSRDGAKKKFFEILFSKPSDALKDLFGTSDWINWINNYKQIYEPLNPHCEGKRHSNLAWLLQTTEVGIMRQVWSRLVKCNIGFLSVHDEIIVKEADFQQARSIFESVLSKEFAYFKLNAKEPFPCTKNFAIQSLDYNETSETNYIEHTPRRQAVNLKPFFKELVPSWDIRELETHFDALKLSGRPIQLNKFSSIIDVRHFIDSHIEIITHNNGNSTFTPYYQRLIKLKELLKTI